jgi:hypothetical protein
MGVRKGSLTGGPRPGNLNEFKIQNFVQTWFTPKVTISSSKNLDKNTRQYVSTRETTFVIATFLDSNSKFKEDKSC